MTGTRGRYDPTLAARHQRDAGLERGRTITKGIAAAAVAAVAATGIYLSQALPGHSATTSTTSGGTSTSSGSSSSGAASDGSADAGSSGSGISAPASAPSPAYQQAPVSSGAS